MNIMSMKHLDAVDVLRATKQRVKLVVLRRPSGVSCSFFFVTRKLLNPQTFRIQTVL